MTLVTTEQMIVQDTAEWELQEGCDGEEQIEIRICSIPDILVSQFDYSELFELFISS